MFSESLIEQKSFKSRFKNSQRESLMRTICGSELQTVGADNRKARLEKSVLMNGLSNSGMVAERKVRLQARSAIRRCR